MSIFPKTGAFNSHAIVFDNSPWRPGREMGFDDKSSAEEDERKLKNLATRIMSNGVEVLVKDKNAEGVNQEQRNIKTKLSSLKPPTPQSTSKLKKLLSSEIATVINRQYMSALLPLKPLIQNNVIIKTCLTTYTYLTTIVHNKRSAISTFETVVSVITTESLSDVFATDFIADIKPTRTKFSEVKTIIPSAVISNIYKSNLPKIEKRIDDLNIGEDAPNFDLIQPSEVEHASCSSSCSCSKDKTESLKTSFKPVKYTASKFNFKSSIKDSFDQKTQYPYEFESTSNKAPTDKIVEKYTEVINDYSEEKESLVEQSELLTNEQAPMPSKNNKVATSKPTDKIQTEKPQKHNKNKFAVADLLKLGTLGIKKLSQLAPVFEKMTGSFIKRTENKTTSTTSTTIKPVTKVTPYNVEKRIVDEPETKPNNFPIYIPVDEMETSESQLVFTNVTLHQNLAWANDYKHPKAHNIIHPKAYNIIAPKIVHESPLVNGGIPISPGEIIRANSDVIVGKPAVGGPLTLAASGINLQNPSITPPIDSFISSSEQHFISETPPLHIETSKSTYIDDSFDLRPPEPPQVNSKKNRNKMRLPPKIYHSKQQQSHANNIPLRPPILQSQNDQMMKTELKKSSLLSNHGRPAFLDYIPSLEKSTNKPLVNIEQNRHQSPKDDLDLSDNSASSSEIINTRVRNDGEPIINSPLPDTTGKPFLVDIQPSKVANVLIPRGSQTALVFAGSSEPHKTGNYVDDPLPYPEPGYFGSFSIDAPQMTNVQSVAPSDIKPVHIKPNPFDLQNASPTYREQNFRNEQKIKWTDNKQHIDYARLPPPVSNQETHVQIGPQITVYNPDVYKPTNNGEFIKYNRNRDRYNKDGKEIIDKDYENYLAVPPPPPSKVSYDRDTFNGNSKPFSHKPVVHTKPVQDMKVFLNIQHPVPKKPNQEISQNQLPPKVTSEVYYAAQPPPNMRPPAYDQQNKDLQYLHNTAGSHQHYYPHQPDFNQYPLSMPSTSSSNPISTNDVRENKNTYTVTLNTATNVANDIGVTGQVIGSSIPVSLGLSEINMNADIPVGTNFAIKVEDKLPESQTSKWSIAYHDQPYNSENPQEHKNTINHKNTNEIIGSNPLDNKWNISSVRENANYETTSQNIKNNQDTNTDYQFNKVQSEIQNINSHANFPMINENLTENPVQVIKPVTEYVDEVKVGQKRPGKFIPNAPTNAHGWYSSVTIDDFDKINNIKVETSTRKIIPLIHDYYQSNLPEFGQKIASIGKPPSEFWAQSFSSEYSGVGKPFSKSQSTEKTHVTNFEFTQRPFNSNFILHHDGKQPVYDIPIRDNSEETTTIKPSIEDSKPVYENAEEIYDGEEEADQETDGEVSQESNKIPIISVSEESNKDITTPSESSLLQDEILYNNEKSVKTPNKKLTENTGSQTEKPFDAESYNKSHQFQSNAMKPIYDSDSQMKPRPFTINGETASDHQLHQPHWQINQLVENATNTSYEENLDLNIGEEIGVLSTNKPTSTQKVPIRHFEVDNRYKKNPRPVFSLRPQSHKNDSIITSTIHIQDKKPLTVMQETTQSVSSLPTFTNSDFESNKTLSDIFDLSPPPPTLDYNFKPSTNDETIMGMSPPPPRSPLPVRLPTRLPITSRPVVTPKTPPYRTKPPRTFAPRIPLQRPTKKPTHRDEISTYRPAYDILSNVRRPGFNRDQPSSQLLPPPVKDIISKPISSMYDIAPSSIIYPPSKPQVVFPTPVSSGWLTSSGVEFSSKYYFEPSQVQYSDTMIQSDIAKLPDKKIAETTTSKESLSSNQHNSSSETPLTEANFSKETVQSLQTFNEETTSNESSVLNSFEDKTSSESMKVIPLRNKNRTRKPYPVRIEDKKQNSNKIKLPIKPSSVIKPTRTLSRLDKLHPTRLQPPKKLPRPSLSRYPIETPTEIESSESAIDDLYIKPTEVLKESNVPTVSLSNDSQLSHEEVKIESSIVNNEESKPVVIPTHHAGNEIKIVDEVQPTKTEFKTTVVTLTKTLSEPPKIVSSIGYINITHTLTVTHTKTSLVSLSEGAVTQTLVLTNTHTSTIVDIVTKVETQVLPTTIVETVTKHVPIQVAPTPVLDVPFRSKGLEDISVSESSEDNDNLIIRDNETTEHIQKIDQETENDNDTFFVVMNKSQNGGRAPPIVNSDSDNIDYGLTRNEQINSNGVSQVLFGEILLAGTPYLETTNIGNTGGPYGKQCQPDCKASRNERCQRIDGIMKCVCRPGFARMFPDRPCKPTYTYSVKLALNSQGAEKLRFDQSLSDNSSKEYNQLALAAHEGLNRMIMQSDLRDVYHGVHINGFQPIDILKDDEESYKGVANDFYVQLSDNAHESRLKEVIEKYLRNNNYSLGGTEVYAAEALMDKLEVNDFDECLSGQFHDCSEHSQCFNLRGTYTCSCLEGYADLSVNPMYPGRICSAEPVGCEKCNYHGSCYSRDDRVVLCECFQWYAGSTCHINLKVVLISLVTLGALLTIVLVICAIVACSKKPRQPPARSIVACIQSMPGLPQGGMPSKQQRADRRALINERTDSGDASSLQNASLPYIPAKKQSLSGMKRLVPTPAPTHDPPPPPPEPAVMIPRARLYQSHRDSRDHSSRKQSVEQCNEAKLISYLESGATTSNDEMMRRKTSMESSYSIQKDRHNKQGALVSAGFKVSTTIKPDGTNIRDDRDDLSSINKNDLESELARFDSMRRKSYSQDNLSEWTDAERRIGELTLSEARSVGGTLPASTGRAASSTRLTHQEANTMAERDLGSTFLLPHVHLYKPDITSDVSEFDSL